ncbi:glycine betaine ABC transporter substrate-binding protein [Paraburkholderia hayleyella]|uniref:ABC transporter substrate-binding protein n=1 Tax=Paraburkholderia hayleyella TaxID=2152889 RepID=UPI0012913033|nr:glycine betaine ABC transporter substrate-binding protein [Paraburkholderia hayleyella]
MSGKFARRFVARCTLAAVTAAVTVITPAFAKTPVVLGQLTWDEPRAVDAVLKVVLEKYLDAQVSLIAADQSAIFAAMDKGDGAVDVHPAIWSAAQTANLRKYVDERKTVALNKAPYFATDGFYVPRYMADKYKIRSVTDLKKPEIAKLFDVNGDGRGDFWPGAPGWGVTDIYRVKAKSYGLTQYYDAYIVPDALFKAQLKKRYAAHQGMLFYYWKPEALFQQYDLVKLEEPKFDGYAMDSWKGKPEYKADGCYNYIEPQKSADWLEKSRITCETPPQPIYIGYTRTLEKRAPQIAAFLSRVAIRTDDVNAWIYDMTVNGKTPDAMAEDWVARHPDRVKAWVGN